MLGKSLQAVTIKNKRNFTLIVLSAITISLIFAPFPWVSAVSVIVGSTSISTTSKTMSLDVVVRDPSVITFPTGINIETIPSGSVIRIIIDPQSSSSTYALFSLNGTRLSNTLLQSGQTADSAAITSLTFNGVKMYPVHTGPYGTFGYGYGYGYGYGFFTSLSGYGYGTLGYGNYGYGLTANTFAQDTTGSYNIAFDPAALTSGTHNIRVDILQSSGSTQFFTSGAISFTNTLPAPSSSSSVNLPAGASSYTVSSATPTLVALSGNLPSTITAGAGITSTIDFSKIITAQFAGSTDLGVTITNLSTITANVGGVNYVFTLPAGVTIRGPATWDGTFHLPQAVTGVTAPGGGTLNAAIEVGAGDIHLTFDKSIKLVLPGRAGDHVFFTQAGTTSQITTTCNDDTQAGADAQLGVADACQIDSGSDKHIWTKHFSTFGSFTPATASTTTTTTSSSTTSGGSGSGGGGGGGGGASTTQNAQNRGLAIYQVSYDVCNTDKASILVGTPNKPTSLDVKIRTLLTGIAPATLSKDQPYQDSQKYLFEAPLNPREKYFIAYAQDYLSSVSQEVNIQGCTGVVNVTPISQPSTSGVPASLPPAGSKTFTVSYNGHSFDINYIMSDTIISDTVDEQAKAVTFVMQDGSGGKLSLRLPTGVISAANNQFIISADGNNINYNISETTSDYTTLDITLPQGAKMLTIIGTSVIPEFGPIAALVLAIAIISIITVSAKTGLRFIPKY